ncbi:MAG: M20/M25/M40 family metallo-hydrolase [Candidatus Hydrogenedentes bacterium]|nr:M20/M25/M40 family metallo-hydrolase [Candidatus Hydrogenedentota bacterium]
MGYEYDAARMVGLIEELLSVPAPSGREERAAEIVRGKLAAMGYAPETDPAGNVLVRLPGRDAGLGTMAMAAHMDEIGMVVTAVDDDGSLRIAPSGHLMPWKIGERPVTVLGDNESITGVLSFGSTHTPDAGEKPLTWKEARVLTGYAKAELDAKGVRPGSTAVPVRDGRGPFRFGDPADPLIAAWTFDDRAGVAALLELLALLRDDAIRPRRPLIVAFTVSEESGCQGAAVVAHREKPEIFVAIDGCPIPPGSPLELDGRPGTWSKDRRFVTRICAVNWLMSMS